MKYSIIPAFICISTLGTATLGLGGCADHNSATDLPPGKYTSNKSSIDANGTEYDTKTTTSVTQDANGNKTAVTDTTNSKDPVGLFNKTSSTTRKVETDDSN